MRPDNVVLLVSTRDARFDLFRQAVSGRSVRRADNVALALARVAGGGIGLIVLDLSDASREKAVLDQVRQLRQGAPDVPVGVWSESPMPEGFAGRAAAEGASGCVAGTAVALSALESLAGAVGRATPVNVAAPAPAAAAAEEAAKRRGPVGTVVAVMGAHGGAGATTVAMNIAAALAEAGGPAGRVVLAEMRPDFSSLPFHFRPGRASLHLGGHWTASLDQVATRAAASLWPVPSVAGLRILFGPQSARECGEIAAARAAVIVRTLAEEADFLILDLPPSLSAASRECLAASQYLALVVEPLPVHLGLANQFVEAISTMESQPPSISAIVVKHTADVLYTAAADVETQLGIPVMKTIPPAPESCRRAERERAALVCADPSSLAAEALTAVARCFAPRGAGRMNLPTRL
ncbi:MAG: hypothetical protein IT162_15760 [Bryobacterales bacterium]|nr:hypothetical protein [Bryobacterales bacterium]